MIKPPPKTILNFLQNNFELVDTLFQLSKQDNLLKSETIEQQCRNGGVKVDTLVGYGIIRALKSDYELDSALANFMGFLLNDYQLDLPASIQANAESINHIFLDLQQESNVNKITQYIDGLIRELQNFIRRIEGNSQTLLEKTKDLKANPKKLDYSEKVKEASLLIDDHVKPLNSLLSREHPQSMTNQLSKISKYANTQRLEFDDFNIRGQFDKLYNYTLSADENLLKHSRRLTKELLPLLEVIQYEDSILSGLLEFVKEPKKYDSLLPNLISPARDSVFPCSFEEDALFIIESSLNRKPLILIEESIFEKPWLFDKEKYKNMLVVDLPIENFFKWCYVTLLEEYDSINLEKFYSLTSLFFEKDFDVIFSDQKKFFIILENCEVIAPVVSSDFSR